ncbi:MAG TPA: SDR family oxidoreductase [Polyangia bacterium]|nr:SDR family oxidoreductase [Polyangia bacterium]
MKKTALITGASAGLGRELAQLFAADKHDVVLVARRRDQLEELATRLGTEQGVTASVIPADLADPASPARIVEELGRRNLTVDFLINNAGFGSTGRFVDRDLERELAMVQVNVTALVHLTGLLLPGMVARGSGRILNMGSTAGFQPGPFMATYYATKGFVNSWTEALAYELRGTGVTATVVCPGATDTEFGAISGNGTSRLFRMGAMAAAPVARFAYRAMMAGKAVAVPGFRNKLGLQIQRVSTRGVTRAVAARLNQIPGAPQLNGQTTSGR